MIYSPGSETATTSQMKLAGACLSTALSLRAAIWPQDWRLHDLSEFGIAHRPTLSLGRALVVDAPGVARRSTARALLKHAGAWQGSDIEECLAVVYALRGQAEF